VFGRRKKREIEALEAVAGASMHLIQQWAEVGVDGKDYLLKNLGHSLRNLDRVENGMKTVRFNGDKR
jgi:hypothetical protein